MSKGIWPLCVAAVAVVLVIIIILIPSVVPPAGDAPPAEDDGPTVCHGPDDCAYIEKCEDGVCVYDPSVDRGCDIDQVMYGGACCTPSFDRIGEASRFPQGASSCGYQPSRVYVFDDTMSMADIQRVLTGIAKQQGGSDGRAGCNQSPPLEAGYGIGSGADEYQWSPVNYALFFKPGTYTNLHFTLGYNTSVYGLGRTPGDVVFDGCGPAVHNTFMDRDEGANAGSGCISLPTGSKYDVEHYAHFNGLENFWRSAENFTIRNRDKVTWAVSQAAPLRNVQVQNGDLYLFDDAVGSGNPMTSGGFIANCSVSGEVRYGSQQQFLSRNCDLGEPSMLLWNSVFVGCNVRSWGVGAEGTCETAVFNRDGTSPGMRTIVDTTPLIAEKPTLIYEGGAYKMLIPSEKRNRAGVDWSAGTTLTNLKFAYPDTGVAQINLWLATPNTVVVLCPGHYAIRESITMTANDTYLIGVGMPVLGFSGMSTRTKGSTPPCIEIRGGLRRVAVAGIVLQATGSYTERLLHWRTLPGSEPSAAGGGRYLYDVFGRVGGPTASFVSAKTMVQIDEHDVVLDNVWLWRADHGMNKFFGWNKNPCDHGLIVNGHNVTAYGLFVEHTKKDGVVWNGHNGSTYFFQNEFPYDAPSGKEIRDVVAYRVKGANHTGFGWGSYCFFNVQNPQDPVIPDNAFYVDPDVASSADLNFMVTVFLNAYEGIRNVVNGLGGMCSNPQTGGTKIQRVCRFPIA